MENDFDKIQRSIIANTLDLIEKSELTPYAIAKKAGFKPVVIYNLRNNRIKDGKRNLRLNTLVSIADGLGISFFDLIPYPENKEDFYKKE
ncbi:MAG: hypothetical protein RR945_04340 [Erysipelotrichaceae bacterium]